MCSRVENQDAVLSLISGGFDSAVSSFQCIRRGLLTHYLFFNLGGRAHEIAVKEVALFLWLKYGSTHKVKFVSVPFEAVVAEILTKVEDSLMGVVLKRMMLRAADAVSARLGISALVTGESVAQVSSQTLANLSVIDRVSERLVLRPLVTTDKQEIIDTAREIGTEVLSRDIPEYCGVISVRPTTSARQQQVEEQEAGFDFGVLEAAIESATVQSITRLHKPAHTPLSDIQTTDNPRIGDCLIDIRHPAEEASRPLAIGDQRIPVVKVPFYDLATYMQHNQQHARYLLYCEHGTMSRMQAAHLKDLGFDRVAVYQP